MKAIKKIDLVTLEVIRNALPAIANEMSHVLQRASYNMMIYEVRDYCCSFVDVEGNLVAQNTGGVSHFVADLGVVIRDGVRKYGKNGFRQGDVIITNHQRVAGQHLNNVVIYTPFFFGGKLIGFPVIRAHWVDVGGTSTGFGAGGTNVDPWIEGLQIDQIRLYEAGILDEKVSQLLKDNIRYPEASMGDLRSQIAACRLSERRMEELFKRYGEDIVEEAINRIFAASEARSRAVVEQIKDGVYEAESLFDSHAEDEGEPLVIKAKVTVKGSDMTIDLSGCSQQRKSPVNGRTMAGALVAYKAITAPDDPVNQGSFRGLKVIIPEGNYMMARYPAPMASWGRTIPSVVDTVLRALAPAMPDKIPGEHLGVLGGTVVFFGTDPKTGKGFVTQSIEGGGWGGRPWEDGESASVSVCQGDVRNAPIEKMELRCPVMVVARTLRKDSGGPGQFRGGLGVATTVRGLCEGYWNLANTGRDSHPPLGIHGGKPGAPSESRLRLVNERDFKKVEVARYGVPAGTEAMIVTAGGGGWGDPLKRNPEKVREDVKEEYISIKAAYDEYGVIINSDTLQIDMKGTERLRKELSRKGKKKA